jgi:hypothetical protein
MPVWQHLILIGVIFLPEISISVFVVVSVRPDVVLWEQEKENTCFVATSSVHMARST